MFVDTHCHLNMMVFKKSDTSITTEHLPVIEAIVSRAFQIGVTKLLTVGTSVIESMNSILIASKFESVFAAIGIHPCDVGAYWREDLKKLSNLLQGAYRHKIKAIGETGLDFYHQPIDKQRQLDCFRAHIELALKENLPLVIHVREVNAGEAMDVVLRILEEYRGAIRGVNHCFSSNLLYARQLIEFGLYLGINAPLGYPKNSAFRDIVSQLPLNRLILETDAPFLPPQQYRGKQNSPEYIPLIAEILAQVCNVSLDEARDTTTRNAENLFSF